MNTDLQIVERDKWQELASQFQDYNYRQLWDFGIACASRVGAVSEHVVVQQGREIIALADVRIKNLPVTGTGIAYINGGPMVRLGDNEQRWNTQLRAALAALRDYYVNNSRLVLRIQPIAKPHNVNDFQKQFLEMGYSVQARTKQYRTIIVDISQPLEVIRKQLDQKWRNCLNNAEKRNLTVKTGTDEVLFDTFIGLYQKLIQRKVFDIDLTPEFYLQVQKCLPDRDRFVISIVYENNQPVAGHVASILGETCVYLLGATNEAGLKNKAAYLVQWAVIQMAKQRGCRFYDLGGIDPEKNPGVYHFKSLIGGVDITVPGPFEYYPNKWAKIVVPFAEKAYRMYKNIH